VDCRLRDFIPLNAIHLGKIIVGSWGWVSGSTFQFIFLLKKLF
jgi:hypothetical protein